jgi:hypothetical protein
MAASSFIRGVGYRDVLLGHFFDLPLTFFNFGFFFLAAGLASLELLARIAPADFFESPSFLAIFACTDLKDNSVLP